MDVLQLIKEDHLDLKCLLGAIDREKSIVRKRRLTEELKAKVRFQLMMDQDYLIPELSDRFPGVHEYQRTSGKSHKRIYRAVGDLNNLASRKVQETKVVLGTKQKQVTQMLAEYLDRREDLLMPQIRQAIPTQDREDLGQVFLDIRSDELGGLESTFSGSSRPVALSV